MQFGNVLTFLCLSTGALSFKIRAYDEAGCKGSSKEINVEDNTCRDTNVLPQTRSFKVLAYGAGRQRAAFYQDGACNGLRLWQDWWADGGSNVFLKDECIDLGLAANAYGSRSA